MKDRQGVLKDKDPREIRPAKGGVKLKNPYPVKSKKQKESHVIQNVKPPPDTPVENLEPPTEEAARIISQINESKNNLIEAMRSFSRLLNDSKLSENKSEREKQEETLIINELIRSAQTVDRLEPGEGIMSLCVFATRLSLSLRNAGNKLAYKNHLLEKRIEQLEKEVGIEPIMEDPKAKEKQLLMEQAKKLGLKINIED